MELIIEMFTNNLTFCMNSFVCILMFDILIDMMMTKYLVCLQI